MEVEDRFGVSLQDSDLERIDTVAGLASVVVSKLPKSTGVCPTANAFYHLRRLLTGHAGIERRQVRPQARLEHLIPFQRRRVWARVREGDSRVPGLIASAPTRKLLEAAPLLLVCPLVAGCAGLWAANGVVVAGLASLLVLAVGCGTIGGISHLSTRHFPEGIETVADLARTLAAMSLPQNNPDGRIIVEQRTLEEIRRITAEQLGLPLEDVKPESNFVKDLKMG